MSQPNPLSLPAVASRMLGSRAILARPALVMMVDSIRRVESGQSPNPLLPIGIGVSVGRGSFDPALAEVILDLWRVLCPELKAKGRFRLRADFIEASVLLLAARGLPRLVRHKRFDAPRADYRRALPGLVRQLEKLRKKAKRAAIKEVGIEKYRELRSRWQEFAGWLQTHSLICRCTTPSFLAKYYKRVLDSACEIARARILKHGLPWPEDRELRRLVRQALRRIRRYRADFGIRTLLTAEAGGEFLSEFVVKKLKKKAIEEVRYEKEAPFEETVRTEGENDSNADGQCLRPSSLGSVEQLGPA